MPSDAVPLLEISSLSARYDAGEVLQDISLTMHPQEFLCIIGANTAGKSTLLRCISRLVPRARGSIRFHGQELMDQPAHAIPGLGIAHVPEGRHVFPGMTVEENLCLGAFAIRHRPGLAGRLEAVYALFPRLAERRRQRAGTLSGGEQQMVAIGRAMMLEPRLLILDEPSHGLAPIIVEELHRALVDIHARGTSVLLVEQNTALALSVAGRGYVLEAGRVVLEGAARSLAQDPRVREAYLGL
ncbi:branched-chain amino acid ABC transporter ATP-binding protein [Pseudoroseomonas deserti]|uniref:Branched-chain amino acid ABC transporter ATP-binding protein n=1 Tax=Teichococcus deserti TaxID=1817963 RepID=A0A1V2H039_9PROT|nr:ABC transporter ATP-binding protein [Pseudoroseomonas deserti]ONG49519.1 branched-chain amino acid ABC transporter ATP-binding protein [Pseudoroseomonas deserti]